MILNSNMSRNGDGGVNLLSPSALAFVGDTVFDLLVREQLVRQANRPSGKLQTQAARQVCAAAQAEAAHVIEPALDERERAVFLRGRNAHSARIPKNATRADYRLATGLEALFGWLYLRGEDDRLLELFGLICGRASPGDGGK